MLELHFPITIQAPATKVRDTMLGKDTYRQWTEVFNPAGSRYEGDRSQGSKMLFLGPDPKNPDNIGGMVSTVAANKLHEFISLQHIGMISNGIEDTTSDAVKSRVGASENYTFTTQNGIVTVDVDIAITEDFADYMRQTRPQALHKLKELCE